MISWRYSGQDCPKCSGKMILNGRSHECGEMLCDYEEKKTKKASEPKRSLARTPTDSVQNQIQRAEWRFVESFSVVLELMKRDEYLATREIWNRRTAIRVIEPSADHFFPKQFYFVPLGGTLPGSRKGPWSPLQSDLFASDWFVLNLKDLKL